MTLSFTITWGRWSFSRQVDGLAAVGLLFALGSC